MNSSSSGWVMNTGEEGFFFSLLLHIYIFFIMSLSLTHFVGEGPFIQSSKTLSFFFFFSVRLSPSLFLTLISYITISAVPCSRCECRHRRVQEKRRPAALFSVRTPVRDSRSQWELTTATGMRVMLFASFRIQPVTQADHFLMLAVFPCAELHRRSCGSNVTNS